VRYQYIASRIWSDEKFKRLTEQQQRLFLYVLTCPHGNLLGLFFLPIGYISSDLKPFGKPLPKDFEKGIQKDLEALREEGLIDYDENTEICWVKNFLRYNPITNPNQRKAAVSRFLDLPRSPILLRFLNSLKDLDQVLWEALPKDFLNTVPVPVPEPVPGDESPSGLSSSADAADPGAPPGGNGKSKKQIPDCPVTKIVEAYHTILPFLPQVQVIDKHTRANVRNRWLEDSQRWELAWWEEFFKFVGESDFLSGRAKDFKASFSWLMGPKNFAKVLNGTYTNNRGVQLSDRSKRNLAAAEAAKRLIDEGRL
jgi:hypothetical protein